MHVWQQIWKCRAPQESLQKHPPISLLELKVLSRPTALSSFVCVLGPNNNSYGFIILPKGRKCGSCSDFPLQVIKLKCLQFLREE